MKLGQRAGAGARRPGALLLLLASLACAGELRAPDVLLVTCDTLRADHLGLYGYERATSPNLDRIFRDAAIYVRAYATEASTPPSIVSVLSGHYPQEHGVRLFYQTVRDDLTLLPDLLPEAYQSAAFVSNVALTDEALAIAHRFDHYDDFVDEKEPHRVVFERRGERTTEAALHWLSEQLDPLRPLFLWVHFIDPHGPYRPPENTPVRFSHEGQLPVEPGRIRRYQLEPGVEDALDYVDRYDEEIAHFDAALGSLIDGYARLRSLDEALLVFTADHGETMHEREIWFTHGYHVWEEIIRVPLLLRGPGLAPGRRADPVSGVDVLPTILRAVGAEIPDGLPGQPLQEDLPPDRVIESESFHGQHTWRAAIRGDEKWAYQVTPGGIAARHYYDLALDPQERGDGSGGAPFPPGQEARAFADPDRPGEPVRGLRGHQIDAPKLDPRVDERQLERLRALGYVEED